MIVREMTKEDLPRILECERKCFKDPWNEENCLNEFDENPFSHGWVLIDERIVGYAFLWETFEMAQLARIGVDPDDQGKGYGDILLKACIQRSKEQNCEFMTLDVRVSNEKAIRLYQKNVFIQVNVSKRYYPDGEDALVFTRAL